MSKNKIYCIHCGTENTIKSTDCIKCSKPLNKKYHPLLEYMKSKIREDLKSKVEDKAFSIIINYIKSNLYGCVLSISILASLTSVIVNVAINHNDISKVTEKPTITKEVALSIDDEVVKELYENQKRNHRDNSFRKSYYEDKYVTFNDLDKETIVYLANPSHILLTKDNCEFYTNEIENGKNLCEYLEAELVVDDIISYFIVDAKDFENKVKKVFGNDKAVNLSEFKEFKIYEDCTYYEKAGNYLCSHYNTAVPIGDYSEMKIIKATKKGNILTIYDKFFVRNEVGQICRNKNCTKKITVEVNDFDDYFEYAQTYKHTYIQDKEGNYYWFSSEPVDD